MNICTVCGKALKTCTCEPTLSHDCLEAVPAWGVRLMEIVDMLEELVSTIDLRYACVTKELKERVAKLEHIIELHFEDHPPVELELEPTPWEDLD
ncbi:unnamed protein product [marine sediment metagenome]|uniref:Uncharacterized protein n=1 Tax=marine sediment metagenome TaxID=412755 RepID=X1A8L8_9ZZZZ